MTIGQMHTDFLFARTFAIDVPHDLRTRQLRHLEGAIGTIVWHKQSMKQYMVDLVRNVDAEALWVRQLIRALVYLSF